MFKKVLEKYVFSIQEVAEEQFFANFHKEIPILVQFFICSNLFSKLKKNCAKVDISLLQLVKNCSYENTLMKNTYFSETFFEQKSRNS